jgi:energy-coupling factor transporter transmembrane protein EcfT
MDSRKESPLVILTRALPPAVVGAMVFQVAAIVGCLMIGAVLLGLFVDARLGTRPLVTLVLSLISLPLSIWLTYRVAMRTVSKARAAYESYLESNRAQAAQQSGSAQAEDAARTDGLALDSDR